MGARIFEQQDISKMTIYDSIKLLKESFTKTTSESHEDLVVRNHRHTLEGALILASPSIAFLERKISDNFYPADIGFKYGVGSVIRDKLLLYSHSYASTGKQPSIKDLFEIISKTNHKLTINGNKKDNIPYAVSQMVSIDKKSRYILCTDIGKNIENNIEIYYKYKGYKSDFHTMRNTGEYIRSEMDFITKIVCDVKERKDYGKRR